MICKVKEFHFLDVFKMQTDDPKKPTVYTVRCFPTRRMISLKADPKRRPLYDRNPDDMKISIKDLRDMIAKGELSHRPW